MTTVGIVGTFDVDNFGDLLFPIIAEHELTTRLPGVELRRYSYHGRSPDDWPFEVRDLTQLSDEIAAMDLLVVGGGDLVRYDQTVAPGYLPPNAGIRHPQGFWLDPTHAALEAGVPVVWNCVGAPFDIPAGEVAELATVLCAVDYLAARDEVTAARLGAVAPAAVVHVRPDTAWGIRDIVEGSEFGNPIARQLGISGDYVVVQAMWQWTIPALRASVGDDVPIVVVPVSPVAGDATPDIAPAGAVCAPGPHPPLALAALLLNAHTVLCSSLHATIAARAGGATVLRPLVDPLAKYRSVESMPGVAVFDPFGPIEPPAPAPAAGRAAALDDHWNTISALATAGTAAATMQLVLSPTTMHTEPYTWGTPAAPFDEHTAARLAAIYPLDHMRRFVGADSEKQWSYWARPLMRMGAAKPSFARWLSPDWQRLATALVGAEYRAWVSAQCRLDLMSVPIEINVFHYDAGDSLGPHVDLGAKLVTHVLYFNDWWDAACGGELAVLGSSDAGDVHSLVTPQLGHSALIVRSERSWHTVRAVTGAARRRSVTVTFYRPGSPSTMWPLDDLQALTNLDA